MEMEYRSYKSRDMYFYVLPSDDGKCTGDAGKSQTNHRYFNCIFIACVLGINTDSLELNIVS